MISSAAIQSCIEEIVGNFNPAKIILFGSCATGEITTDSDVDLLVVMPHRGASYRMASRLRLAMDVDFPLDILVRSPAELCRRLAMRDVFISDIVEQGIVLHDVTNRRVGEQGRRRLRRRLHSAAIAKAQPV